MCQCMAYLLELLECYGSINRTLSRCHQPQSNETLKACAELPVGAAVVNSSDNLLELPSVIVEGTCNVDQRDVMHVHVQCAPSTIRF